MAQLLLIFLLTSINAFFASAEMAIVSVNRLKVRKLDYYNFIVKGHLSVSEFNNKFNIDIEEGVEIKVKNIHLIISKVNNRRVEDIKVK